MKSYDAWLLDLDGTLYHPLGVKALMAMELVTRPVSIPVLRSFRRQHEALRVEAFQGESHSPFEEQILRTARETGIDPDPVRETVTRFMIDKPGKWIHIFRRKPLLREISSFREAGGKTALVSDYPARSKLKALHAEHLFDIVVANGEPGGPPSLKPSPEGYLLAAQRIGVPPSRCLVIGDRADADGQAAQRAGMAFRLVP